MAWIVIDLDHTLVNEGEEGQVDPMTLEPIGPMPVPGAPEACMQLASEGHRLTVYTSRFAPMPDSERQRLKEQIEQELQAYGFPPMEVWSGFTKPAADVFIGHNHITYDGDWNLALAQTEMMLTEMGLGTSAPAPMMSPDEAGPEETDGAEQQPDDTDPSAGSEQG